MLSIFGNLASSVRTYIAGQEREPADGVLKYSLFLNLRSANEPAQQAPPSVFQPKLPMGMLLDSTSEGTFILKFLTLSNRFQT